MDYTKYFPFYILNDNIYIPEEYANFIQMSEQDKSNFVLKAQHNDEGSLQAQKYYFFSSISDLFNSKLKDQIDIKNKNLRFMDLNQCPDN